MTVRHLKIFLAVYQEMSITKAAQKLHLAQPSVSLAIKELEDKYQIRLFDRISRRLFITDEGKAFYDYASHIMDLFEEMENSMASPSVPPAISIGSSITIGTYVVPEIAAKFRKRCPSGKLNVSIQNSHKIIEGVQKNEIDIGLVEDRVESGQLVSIPFMEDQMYFICSRHHELAKKRVLTLEELAGYPFLMREPGSASREITDAYFKSHQIKVDILWESVSNQALIEAVKKNCGIAVLSEKIIEQDLSHGEVCILPWYPEVFLRKFTLIYHKKKYISSTMEELIQLIAGEKKKEERQVKNDEMQAE